VKSKLPWEYPWIWSSQEEQEHYGQVFRRINSDPHLKDAVHFDGFGGDVPAWLRKIGWVLSTSDDESFHLAPAEGMASRALPMILPWPGADSIYPGNWVKQNEYEMAESILATTAGGDWTKLGEQARAQIEENFSVERVCQAWEQLVTSI
jgi:glycosyltransferase involved in cell wall biosynthesis